MAERLIDDSEIRRKGITYTRQHRDRLIDAGKFPKPVKGAGKANAWVESEIDDYIAARIRERNETKSEAA
jgi:prophage regulatory protein